VLPGTGIAKEDLHRVVDCPSVRWVGNGGAGVEHLMPWDADRVTVTNASGVLSDYLAEFVISALQMANIGFPELIARQRRREWRQHAWTPMAGKTLCVLGLGHVGRAVAKRASGLGMRVVGTRANPAPTDGVEKVYGPDGAAEAVAGADFVAVHAAETPASRGLVDADVFAAMESGVVFLNASRGPVVDTAALIEALEGGRIRTAILDVFDEEPLPPDHPLWAFETVVVTPHMADYVPDWPRRFFEAFLDNMDRFRAGAPLANVVDPARGY